MVAINKWTRRETGPNGTCKLVEDILKSQRRYMWRRSNAGFSPGLRIGSVGWPDFDLIAPKGRYIALECKGYTGKSMSKPTECSDSQRLVLREMSRLGCMVWVVHDPNQIAWMLSGGTNIDVCENVLEMESRQWYATGNIEFESAVDTAKQALKARK